MNNILNNIKMQLNNNPDIVTREIVVSNTKVGLIFLKSTLDKMLFVQSVLSPLLEYDGEVSAEAFEQKVLKVFEVERIEKKDYITNITKNKVVLIIDGQKIGLALDLELLPTRAPEEPPTSSTLYGPREGFTESVKTTTALIRGRFPTKELVIRSIYIGDITQTHICLYYLKNIADLQIVNKLMSKLQKIKTDGIVDSHYIVEFLERRPNSMFEQFGLAEKPDIVCAKMLEGRIAIAVNGSPIVITVPYIAFEDIQSSNDYYINRHYATFIRYIRCLALILATVVPGVYLSFRLYHYKIIPMKYIVTINSATQNLPFTPFLELLFILVLFQILYEVSLRLPRYLGLATSIVGALVLGDTGVQAGLISPPGIIVIAMSIISVYAIPNQAPQITLIRLFFLIIGGTLGISGIVAGMIYFVNYLNGLNEYGAPYLAPYAPRIKSDLKDGLIRQNMKTMKKRPRSFPVGERSRGGGAR